MSVAHRCTICRLALQMFAHVTKDESDEMIFNDVRMSHNFLLYHQSSEQRIRISQGSFSKIKTAAITKTLIDFNDSWTSSHRVEQVSRGWIRITEG
ncbi:hypothetical protein LZ554_000582 [Drepanopeziza brunnea f. sp. 'monogermtubi']|nr:hypothetical protein LZ554_000582 [Drepanopeziza brunnea f. sp. 'monogermtubi']